MRNRKTKLISSTAQAGPWNIQSTFVSRIHVHSISNWNDRTKNIRLNEMKLIRLAVKPTENHSVSLGSSVVMCQRQIVADRLESENHSLAWIMKSEEGGTHKFRRHRPFGGSTKAIRMMWTSVRRSTGTIFIASLLNGNDRSIFIRSHFNWTNWAHWSGHIDFPVSGVWCDVYTFVCLSFTRTAYNYENFKSELISERKRLNRKIGIDWNVNCDDDDVLRAKIHRLHRQRIYPISLRTHVPHLHSASIFNDFVFLFWNKHQQHEPIRIEITYKFNPSSGGFEWRFVRNILNINLTFYTNSGRPTDMITHCQRLQCVRAYW